MLDLFIFLQTPAAGEAQQTQDPTGGWSTIIMIVAMIAIFYFMMIRPQKKRQKEIQKFREGLKEGDRVVTSGGLYGKISSTKDAGYFIVDLGGNVKVRVAKECVFPSAEAANENAAAEGK